MITNNQVKYVKSLHQRKFRQKYNNFIAEGDKIAREILKKSLYNPEIIFATSEWIDVNEQNLNGYSDKVVAISDREMQKISALSTASPVLMVLDKNIDTLRNLNKCTRAIYLNGVQDPGNVGTIIRIADWFGIEAIIRDKSSADFFHPKVVQSTMGSFLNVDLYTLDINEAQAFGFALVGTQMDGIPIDRFLWPDRFIIVMGSEGSGMSSEVMSQLDHSIRISGVSGKVAESLNVAVAAGIVCSRL